MSEKVVNVTFAGIGGQGVLKASDILAEVVFSAGFDVKKSEVHGMSQRGGSVCSEVRYGTKVNSPMVPEGESDFLVMLAEDQVEINIHKLKEGGTLIRPNDLTFELENKKSLNVAMLGLLSSHLDIPEQTWLDAIAASLPEKVRELNFKVFKQAAAK